jgi:hypothetical protein
MKLFSERMGLRRVRSVVQVDSVDRELRNRLWNVLSYKFLPSYEGSLYVPYTLDAREFSTTLWLDYFNEPVDELPESWREAYGQLKGYFFNCEWFHVYDFLEFVARVLPDPYRKRIAEFTADCNDVLKRELSAYRFVGIQIAPITSEEEIAEIEEALAIPDALNPVRTHLRDALGKLADRKSPDYRNSIKESISAVEALCQLIMDDSKATLGQALKKVEGRVPLHGALKDSFISLYGYTSDADGIRHALLKEPTLDFEDAKFMLVACSAFVNYLVEKASKAEIEF